MDPDALPASMGIYVFDRAVLAEALAGTEADFGKHVIPKLIETHRVLAFQYQGYWEDIGTIRSFYEANLDLCAPLPQFNFYDATAPIFTHARYLPGTKIIKSRIEQSVIADGCIINDARDRPTRWSASAPDRSRAPPSATRSSWAPTTTRRRTASRRRARRRSASARAPSIERAIVDKNARIGDARAHLAGRQAGRTSTGPTSTCGTASW